MRLWAWLWLVILAGAWPAGAQEGAQWARIASREGIALYLSAGTLWPLTDGESDGETQALRAADALLLTVATSEALKQLVREVRPDGSDAKSFPSMHTATAFTIAAMRAADHPQQAAWWYLGAALIGAARVEVRQHYLHDVLAGAALGYAIARLELDQPRGVLIAPWLDPAALPAVQPLWPDPPAAVTPWLGTTTCGLRAQWRF